MNREYTEMPPVEIPDEITQVDLPEFEEYTPHPDPSSPQVTGSGEHHSGNSIGFLKK
ncbi:hypothetical protein [Brevibacillus migulae]|uniref:hypothetical protein n=1 Tax=Brevibacillus migulae TaxID=1644114 RepID=UPI00142F4DFD|nr:hypothetical protein [Brevibacillus migulae]